MEKPENILKIRKNIYGMMLDIQDISSRLAEIKLSYRSIQMARHWSGKLLAYIGFESPYSEPESVKDIAEIADIADDYEKAVVTNEQQLLQRINDLRNRLQVQIDILDDQIYELINACKLTSKQRSLAQLSQTLIFQHLTEAKGWLGWALSELKLSDNQ